MKPLPPLGFYLCLASALALLFAYALPYGGTCVKETKPPTVGACR